MLNKSLVMLMAIAALGVSSSLIRSGEIRSCLAAGARAGPMVKASTVTTLSLQLIRNLYPLQR